jgi:hypothetical protein
MATLALTPIKGYAHCRDPRCIGTEQEEVDAICHTSSWSFVENGGNLPGVERSTEIYVFADEQRDAPCHACGLAREVSAKPRPQYTPLSGHRQDGLLHVKQYNAAAQPPQHNNDAVVAQLMAQVAELSARVAGGNPGARAQSGGATPNGVTTAAQDTSARPDASERRAIALEKARAARAQE